MSTRSISMHFSITGEFITEHTRNLMLEGNWAFALKTLTDGMIGMSIEHCISILDGKMGLTGMNECKLVPEDPADPKIIKYRLGLDTVYGAIVRVRESNKFKWFAPYARVTNYAQADICACYGLCLGNVPMVGNSWGDRKMPRASYYMNDRNNDLCYYPEKTSKHEHAHLFQPCDAPPFWYEINHSFERALDVCERTGYYLEEYGAHQSRIEDTNPDVKDYGDKSNIELDIEAPTRDVDNSVKASLLTSMVAKTGLDPRALASMISGVMGETDTDSKPEADPTCEHESGWIMPDGTFYGCEYYQHVPLAMRILKHVYGFADDSNVMDDIEKAVDCRGWVRCQKSADGVTVTFAMSTDKRLSKKQVSTLQTYCDRYRKDFPSHLLAE